MLAEPMTLYKLMNLYMLKQVNFPLTNAQLSSFFLDRDYTSYFTLQQALNDLLDAGLIRQETVHNSTRYEITPEGEDTLDFFGKTISPAIVEDMNEYLKENNSGCGTRPVLSLISINPPIRITPFTVRCGRGKTS